VLSVIASAGTAIGVPLVIAFVGGGVAVFWPWLQTNFRGRKFEGIIKRELQEIGPRPPDPEKGKPWWEHATMRFVHEEIFDRRKTVENRDFLLSLDPTLVFEVSQLWTAFEKRNHQQWLAFLELLASDEKVGSLQLKEASLQWANVIGAQSPECLAPIRDDQALREQLISRATEVAAGLYLATQRYWRATNRDLADNELEEYRKDLDGQYHQSRIAGMVLENRLRAYFLTDGPRLLCHRAMDLLTVRYFGLTTPGGPTESLRRNNEGDEHSGLSAAQLGDAPTLLSKYHATLKELVEAILREPIAIDSRERVPAK
jgi:hypothetical protein